MNHKYLLVYVLLSLLLSGCVSLYRYRSDGDVISTAGVKHHAVLFWYSDEGRLWYGKKYVQPDSSVQMRVCKVGSKSFVLKDAVRLELPAKAADLRIMELDAEGKLHSVVPPVPLKAGQSCGAILLNGKTVTTKQLMVAEKPSVAIMCKSIRNPDRYPKTQVYSFGSISRSEAKNKERKAPDPCIVP